MGKYINVNSKGERLPSDYHGKIDTLIEDGATLLKRAMPGEVSGLEFQENMVCVVDNGPFAAAGYAYSYDEFRVFNDPQDLRFKTWLTYSHAEALTK